MNRRRPTCRTRPRSSSGARSAAPPPPPPLAPPPSLGVRAREAGLGEQARQPDPALADRGGRDLGVLHVVWDLVLPVHGIETGFGLLPGAGAVVEVDDLACHAPFLSPRIARAVREACGDTHGLLGIVKEVEGQAAVLDDELVGHPDELAEHLVGVLPD